MVKGAQTVQRVISRYHRAIEKKDVDTALGCLSKNYFRTGQESGAANDPTRWRVEGLAPKAALRKGISEGSYKCAVEFLHTHINENMAVVATRETGAATVEGKTHTWKGFHNLWYLTKVKGDWKIIALAHLGESSE